MLDRLRNLSRDREQELDLGFPELPCLARTDVERPGKLLPRQDRHGQDRLVFVLG